MLPATVYRILPPYRCAIPIDLITATQPPGSLIGIHGGLDTTAAAVRQKAAAIYERAPCCSVVVLVDTIDVVAMSHAAEAVLPVVPLDAPDLGWALRDALTKTGLLRYQFKEWLRAAAPSDERLIHVAGLLVEEAIRRFARAALEDDDIPPCVWGVPSMAAAIGMTERGLRAAAARSKLPSPVRLRGLARTLVQALVVQRETEHNLTRVALELGYSSSEALTHAMRTYFDVTPSFVQERLGWRWLATRWLGRLDGLIPIGI